MDSKKIIVGFTSAIFFMALPGCTQQGKFIDAQKSAYKARPAASPQLTEQELFGWDPSAEITEEDIQAALIEAEDEINIPQNASVILVQSGEKIPDIEMRKEMEKYYKVATFSGISPSKQSATNKTSPVAANSYILTLRYLGARGRQSRVIVYWPTLEAGSVNKQTKDIVWQDYQPGSNIDKVSSLRYSSRFAIIDVKSGNWEMYTPASQETSIPITTTGKTTAADIETAIKKARQQMYQMNTQEIYSRFTQGKVRG